MNSKASNQTAADVGAEHARARLAAVVESSDDAIISKTLEGIITSWNLGAERIFGYTADEIVGQSVLKLIPPDRRHEEPVILDRIRNGQRVDHYETVRMRKDGSLIDISLTVSPIRDSTGSIVGVSKIARDISAKRQADRAIQELLESERSARKEAEKLGYMKDEFLATLSHELRTPLNAIIGWAHLLRRDASDQKLVQEGVLVIERNAKLQAQLISDLLDMSRVISGKMRLEVQSVWLPALIERTLEVIVQTAESKGVEIKTRLDPIPEPINCDPTRLQQIVWNLLSNAVKFTPAGGTVTVSLAKVGTNVEITVEDSGKGIRREFLPHIFERFSQQDSSTTRQHGGLGIGLALVRQLTELHGGTVRAFSAGEDMGSTFTVTLPLPADSAHFHRAIDADAVEAHDSGQQASELPDLQGLRVLLVDDEQDALNLLWRVLEDVGATALVATSAAEGLAVLENERVDVLVSDLGMPGTDGFQFIREVREKGIQVPAAALTAFVRTSDRTKALLAGYQVHIGKPVDPTEFLANIATLARRTGT